MSVETSSNEFSHYKLLFIENFKTINKNLNEIVEKMSKRDDKFTTHLIEDAKWKSKARAWISGAMATGTIAVGLIMWLLEKFVFKD